MKRKSKGNYWDYLGYVCHICGRQARDDSKSNGYMGAVTAHKGECSKCGNKDVLVTHITDWIDTTKYQGIVTANYPKEQDRHRWCCMPIREQESDSV